MTDAHEVLQLIDALVNAGGAVVVTYFAYRLFNLVEAVLLKFVDKELRD